MSINADLSGFDRYLDDLGEHAEEAARPAAQAAAQVLYDAVKRNVAGMGRRTGKLAGAIYQAFSEDQSAVGRATYHVSWSHKKAPHGHLLEWGFWQRYQVAYTSKGIVTLVRPGMQDQPKPRRRASQAEKDAYYLPREGGPRFIPGRAFVRGAQSAFPRARDAAEAELIRRIKQ